MITTVRLGDIRAKDLPRGVRLKEFITMIGSTDKDDYIYLGDVVSLEKPLLSFHIAEFLPRKERRILALELARTCEHLCPEAKESNKTIEEWLDGGIFDFEVENAIKEVRGAASCDGVYAGDSSSAYAKRLAAYSACHVLDSVITTAVEACKALEVEGKWTFQQALDYLNLIIGHWCDCKEHR